MLGLSDHNLQRELGAIRNPTLDSFSEKIEGFEQAKRTMSGNAFFSFYPADPRGIT